MTLQRKTALTSRTPLVRKTPWPVRRTRLRPRSKRMAEIYRTIRVPLVKALLEENPWCQIRIEGVCTGRAVDVDEVLSRARGGSITDPDNCRTTCRPCHDYVTNPPADAEPTGSLHSWEKQ